MNKYYQPIQQRYETHSNSITRSVSVELQTTGIHLLLTEPGRSLLAINVTTGQSSLTTGRIAAAHGRFGGIRQVAPVCTLPRASLAHPSPNPKRHLDRFSCFFCTAHGRESPYFTTGRPFPPLKLPLPMGDLDPHLISGSLGPPKSSTHAAPRSVQPFFIAHYCDRQTE